MSRLPAVEGRWSQGEWNSGHVPLEYYPAVNPAVQMEKEARARWAWRNFGIASAVWAVLFFAVVVAAGADAPDRVGMPLTAAWMMFGFVWTGVGAYAIYRQLQARKQP